MVQDTQDRSGRYAATPADTPNCLVVRITVFAAMTAGVQTYHY